MAAYVAYGRAQRHVLRGLFGLAGVALFGIAACSKLGLDGQDDMSWARAALERNDRLEVVAADPQTSTFTVRVKATGELNMVRADQVVGSPPALAAPVASSATAPAAATNATASESSSSSQATSEGTGAPANSSPPFRSEPAATPDNSTLAARDGSANAPGAAVPLVPRTGLQPQTAPAAQAPNPGSDVASMTPGGRLLESGPGYVIKAASKGAPTTAQREQSSKTSAALERRHDPIICQGDRLLQIDNRNLEFDGDAVSAEDGCEIHITNSHISAKGVGVSARAANVHIDNSQIEGDAASIDASGGSQVYFSSSTFRGLSRRLDNSSFHDLGGNVWN